MLELFENAMSRNPYCKLKMDNYSKFNKIKAVVRISELDPKHYKVLNKG